MIFSKQRAFSLLAAALGFFYALPVYAEKLVPMQKGGAPNQAPGTPGMPMQAPPMSPPMPQAPPVQDIHDIYPPVAVQAPINWLDVGLGVLAVIVLAVAGIIIWKVLKKRAKMAPVILPHQQALADLALARSYLLENDSLHYGERASEILRTYIEARFAIKSTRQTTGEFLHAISATSELGVPVFGALAAHSDELGNCLQQFDLIKYAHMQSPLEGLEALEEAIRTFIEKTIQHEVV